MRKRKHSPAAAFRSVKQASLCADKLSAKEPGRHFHVLDHPKERGKFAIGIMAGGVLLCGYVPQSVGKTRD